MVLPVVAEAVVAVTKNTLSKKTHHKNPLLALSASALTLPGMSAQAAVPPEKLDIGIRYSGYEESAIEAKDTISGQSEDRYEIDVFHLTALIPHSDQLSFSVDFDYETMSGATPVAVSYDINTGEQVVLMSSASIEDTRLDLSGAVTAYQEDSWIDMSFGFSDEDDYFALFGGLGFGLEFYGDQTVWDAGISFSSDELTPVGLEITERKSSFNVYSGITQVFNKNTTYQLGVNFGVKTGYLTDPYRSVDIEKNPWKVERRPDSRRSTSVINELRYFVDSLKSAVHLNHRYYQDNWSVNSQTIEGSWNQQVSSILDYTVGLRWYSQEKASFYELYDTALQTDLIGDLDLISSSDYRLSDFDALSFRFRMGWNLARDSKVTLAYEFYSADGDSPALLEFNMLTVGFNQRF